MFAMFEDLVAQGKTNVMVTHDRDLGARFRASKKCATAVDVTDEIDQRLVASAGKSRERGQGEEQAMNITRHEHKRDRDLRPGRPRRQHRATELDTALHAAANRGHSQNGAGHGRGHLHEQRRCAPWPTSHPQPGEQGRPAVVATNRRSSVSSRSWVRTSSSTLRQIDAALAQFRTWAGIFRHTRVTEQACGPVRGRGFFAPESGSRALV